jgi:hypothetical protein
MSSNISKAGMVHTRNRFMARVVRTHTVISRATREYIYIRESPSLRIICQSGVFLASDHQYSSSMPHRFVREDVHSRYFIYLDKVDTSCRRVQDVNVNLLYVFLEVLQTPAKTPLAKRTGLIFGFFAAAAASIIRVLLVASRIYIRGRSPIWQF